MIVKVVGDVKKPRVTILGASCKENVDDTRESPSEALAEILEEKGISISIHDPVAGKFKYGLSGLDDALKGSDLVILMVGHDEFRELDLGRAASLMRHRNLFDTRNFFDPAEVRKAGFDHLSL